MGIPDSNRQQQDAYLTASGNIVAAKPGPLSIDACVQIEHQ